jgi:hypothetical protein
MRRSIAIFIFLFFLTSVVNSQDKCENQKISIFKASKYNPFNDLKSCRINHTDNPRISKYQKMLFQSVLLFNNEYVKTPELNKDISTFNIYSSHRINFLLARNFEFNMQLHELIIYSGDEIQEYGGQNPYSRFSIGTKYSFTSSNNIFAVYGQMALPKKEINKRITSEIKFLYSRGIRQHLCFTSNIGGLFFSKNNILFTYSVEFKYLIRKKIEFILENYRHYTHYTVFGKPFNNILGGCGVYLKKDFYGYITFEKRINKQQLTNLGKVDVGINYCF